MSRIYHNRKELNDNRKALRNNATPEEKLLWKYLQKSQLDGRKFRRQHSIGPYIADFYCPTERLVIELDGADHFTEEGRAYDADRTAYLNELNIQVLRFPNSSVTKDVEQVLAKIKSVFD